ncbi:MAG: Ig-like domain-containing protein [Gemmatimonadaceae bacterium]|nr:Ig-like domain-containing protein [Gemmatimonadaceae bacterium]
MRRSTRTHILAPAVHVTRTGVLRFVVAAATMLQLACGGGDTPPAGPDPAIVTSVSVDQPSVALAAIGATATVVATARNASGGVVAQATYTWTSSAPAVAIVTDGVITSVGVGTANVTVRAAPTAGGATVTSDVAVTVTQAPAAMTLTPSSATLVRGSTQALVATVADARGVAIPAPPITWSTSSPAVATVSSAGLVTALTTGVATITATLGTLSRAATISVVFPDLVLSRDTTLSGTYTFRNITIPTDRIVTASGPLVLRSTGLMSIAGTLVSSCVPIDIGSDTALVLNGARIHNGCNAGTGGDLRIAANGELLMSNSTITSSGDILLTNDSTLSESTFPASRVGSSASGVPGVPFVRLENSTIQFHGGGTGPNPATDGTNGTTGGNGANGRRVRMLLNGNAIFAGGTLLWAQDGGNGGSGTQTGNTALSVSAGNGGSGGDIRVLISGSLTYSGTNNRLRSGRGGRGGAATATTLQNAGLPAAPSATALGGAGAAPGLIDIRAGGGIAGASALTLDVPSAGDGGNATATAAHGVDALVAGANAPAQPGGSATATGGRGGSTPNARLSASGVSGGSPTVVVVGGGAGGNAQSTAGDGGRGAKPQKNGAAAGAVVATGGAGGDSRLRNLANVLVGAGGNGGNAAFLGGNGGAGWNDCQVGQLEAGGVGGAGGSATGARGAGGVGAAGLNGTDGTTRFSTVGNGGRGGDGAPRGAPGAAGANAVAGAIGVTVAPIFQAGADGVDCTPAPPPQIALRLSAVQNSGGVVAAGTQSVPVEVSGAVRGTMPITFAPPTFVGSSPDRLGLNTGGSIIFRTGQTMVDGAPYPIRQASFCLVNAPSVSPANPVVVRKLDANGATVKTTSLTSPTACYDDRSLDWFALYVAVTLGGLDLADFLFRP